MHLVNYYSIINIPNIKKKEVRIDLDMTLYTSYYVYTMATFYTFIIYTIEHIIRTETAYDVPALFFGQLSMLNNTFWTTVHFTSIKLYLYNICYTHAYLIFICTYCT